MSTNPSSVLSKSLSPVSSLRPSSNPSFPPIIIPTTKASYEPLYNPSKNMSSLWIYMSRYYPSKGPYLMPSTDPNIWPTHTPSAKPSNIQSFFHYGIMAYVPCGYLFKYTKVFPSFSQ